MATTTTTTEPGMLHTCPRCGWSQSMPVTQAAEYMGVSDETIRIWIREGVIVGAVQEPFPPSFRWQVPVAELDRLKEIRGGGAGAGP